MEGFDTITMSYLAAPMSLSSVTAADQLAMPLLPLDNLDHHSNYDNETFAGSDDATFNSHQHAIQPPPPLKRFSSTYDDPFSDALSAYEHPQHADQNGGDSPSIERDNKLLGFSLPTYNYTLLDYALRRTSISLLAQLHGMFFLAESPWASAGDASAPPTELTCYRRNLFQITGTITLPRTLQYILTEQGEQIPILGQELTISATESVEGNPVKIISVPWKTPASSTMVVEDKTEKEPPSIPLDLNNGQDIDSEFVNFPVAWKRLQFRIATANNGRRKELQQHFVVRLKVMATLSTGARIPVCEAHSGAIIVRGRSPRNFQSRKDFPISGGTTAGRKAHIPSQPTRTSTGDSSHGGATLTPDRSNNNNNKTVDAPPLFPYDSDLQVSPDFFEWKIPHGQGGAMTAIPPDVQSYAMPAPGGYAQSSPDLSRTRQPSRAPPPPINLSLTDEEPKKSASPSEGPKKAPRLTPGRPPSFSLNLINSPDESADLLYEYFPLGLDDWMPPVDAVYRPHVVHHLASLPTDPKVAAVKSRSKRYFSEDQP